MTGRFDNMSIGRKLRSVVLLGSWSGCCWPWWRSSTAK